MGGRCDGERHVHTQHLRGAPEISPLEIQAKAHQQKLGVTETSHFREISTAMPAKVLPV